MVNIFSVLPLSVRSKIKSQVHTWLRCVAWVGNPVELPCRGMRWGLGRTLSPSVRRMRWTCLRLTDQPSCANKARIRRQPSGDGARTTPRCADVVGSVSAEAVGLDTDRLTDANPERDTPDAPSTAAGQRHALPLVFSASDLPFFLVDLFQDTIFQHGFGQHCLHLGVFFY